MKTDQLRKISQNNLKLDVGEVEAVVEDAGAEEAEVGAAAVVAEDEALGAEVVPEKEPSLHQLDQGE